MFKNNLNTQTILLFFLILLFASVQVQAKKNIFVLHSYAQEYTWTKQQHEAFTNDLKNNYTKPIKILTEHLDTKRIAFDTKYKQFFLAYLQQKYDDYQADVIYATDDNALLFLKEYKKLLFPYSPIVFSGVNDLSLHKTLSKKQYTGVFETKEIKPNIDLIHTFSPQTKEIYFIGDHSVTYHSIEKKIKKVKDDFKKMNFNFIANQSISKVINELKKLTAERTFIILTTIGGFLNDEGKNITLQESISQLTEFDNLIIISMEDAYMFPNVVGGYVTSGKKQGEFAAKMVKSLLEGKNIESIDYITKSPNIYMFDQQSLNKTRLFLASKIEKNVEIINTSDSFYQQNSQSILNIIFLLILIASISLLLYRLILNEKNKRIKKEAITLAKTLPQKKFKQTSLGHWDWDLKAKRLDCSQGLCQLLSISEKSQFNSYKKALKYIHPEDLVFVKRFINDSKNNKTSAEIEHRIRLSNSLVKKVHHQIDIQLSDDGSLLHLLGTVHKLSTE